MANSPRGGTVWQGVEGEFLDAFAFVAQCVALIGNIKSMKVARKNQVISTSRGSGKVHAREQSADVVAVLA